MAAQQEQSNRNLFGLTSDISQGRGQFQKHHDFRRSAHHYFPAIRWDSEQSVALSNSFSKAELTGGWFYFAKKFYQASKDKRWAEIDANHLLQYINTHKDFTKEDYFLISFAVLKNKEIFTDFLNFLPDATRKALVFLAWNTEVSREQMEEILQTGVFMDNRNLLPGLKLMKRIDRYSYSSTSTKIDFYLPAPVSHIITEYLDKPEGYYITPLQEINFAEDVQLFSAEQCIFDELPRLLAYHQQGRIKYNVHGKPSLSNIKKICKDFGIQEFYKEKSAFPVRTMMLAGLLYEYAGKELRLEEIVKILSCEHFVWNYKNSNYQKTHAPLYIFNFLKGLGSLGVDHFNGSLNYYLIELLKKTPPQQWITQTNYNRHLAYNMVPIFPFNYEGARKLYFDDGNEFRHQVDNHNSQQIVNLPYVKGLIFVLASLGLLEIAYREVNTTGQYSVDWYSEYDGLEAFRLTPLGAYALGITPSYESPRTLTENKFVFEEEALIMRVEGDLTLLDVILGQFLEKTAPNRYAFSSGLFLNECRNAGDIKNKIESFKQVIKTSLPRLWENELDLLLANLEQIHARHQLVIYQIDPKNKNLQRLFAQDPVLKTVVLKAEQFHILIKKSDLARFKTRLKELGFFVGE